MAEYKSFLVDPKKDKTRFDKAYKFLKDAFPDETDPKSTLYKYLTGTSDEPFQMYMSAVENTETKEIVSVAFGAYLDTMTEDDMKYYIAIDSPGIRRNAKYGFGWPETAFTRETERRKGCGSQAMAELTRAYMTEARSRGATFIGLSGAVEDKEVCPGATYSDSVNIWSAMGAEKLPTQINTPVDFDPKSGAITEMDGPYTLMYRMTDNKFRNKEILGDMVRAIMVYHMPYIGDCGLTKERLPKAIENVGLSYQKTFDDISKMILE
ncbi:MAG: hypothetical protein ABIA21_04025 [Candidatus Aenigmatarchaeota archaeon]